jgi:hypothetical protein
LDANAPYNHAFKILWSLAVARNLDPNNLTTHQVAGLVQFIHGANPNLAKNAYAAVLQIPGFESLRCSPLLATIKRVWNKSQPKYSTFWDGDRVLRKLANTSLNWTSISAVRERLILVMRLLHLTRSIDLARCYRAYSHFDNAFWVLLQRKGDKGVRWERLIRVSHTPAICPCTLLQRYVQLTPEVSPGAPLLATLQAPYTALTASRIAAVTKVALAKVGVSTKSFAPHSTRGAGVNMYKKWGFSSEQVCEIGKWKNVQTFSAHYMRLNAAQEVERALLNNNVHTVSPEQSAEPDRSRTPETFGELGGSDLEGEAQSEGETCFYVAGCLYV